jgi:hypothetical protein
MRPAALAVDEASPESGKASTAVRSAKQLQAPSELR